MIQLMPPFLNANATHGKGNDYVSFFDKGVVQVAAVHACVRRSGNRSGRWIQTFDFGRTKFHLSFIDLAYVDVV